jgi:CPA1 family monovalent cation:H+ antiporter
MAVELGAQLLDLFGVVAQEAPASEGIENQVIDLLAVFVLAAGVGVFVAKVGRFPYTIALLLAGLVVSVLGLAGALGIDLALSHDIIFLVLLPPLLFEGAATTDLEAFRADLPAILTLAVVGLLLSVVVLGALGPYVFGFPLLVSLLFAATILPTDPVSVLALFDELGAPERLKVLVEGESLLNDGVGVVVFTTLLAVVRAEGADVPLSALLVPERLGDAAVEIVVASLGGVLVGLLAGYAVYRVMVGLDEHRTEIVLTFVLAYGSFLLAEHYVPRFFGVTASGVIATVVAGLFVGNRGAEYAMSPQTKVSIFDTLDTAAFVANAFIFVAIGITTPIDQLAEHAPLIAGAVVFVLLARAVAVYPIATLVNQLSRRAISREYQHVMFWGGLHASIPIALVLGLPATLDSGAPFPFREELRAMVFGVAAFSLVVQGLTMERLLDRLGIVTRSDAEELYELLVGRARAVEAALDAAEALREGGDLPGDVYEDFLAEYREESEDLERAIGQLIDENPRLRREEILVGERRVLKREKSAILDAMRSGAVSDAAGERLLEEVNLKLDRIESGESTVEQREEGYEEFWRARAAEFGLDGVALDAPAGREGDSGVRPEDD